ncbi:MAG: pyruvate, water dikinase regulatory protein [Gammaproteobacteria bacterium]
MSPDINPNMQSGSNLDKVRSVFFISDSTCITAQHLGRALLTQFEFIRFTQQTYRFVHNAERAQAVVAQINRAAAEDGQQPLIFCTMTDQELRAMIRTSNGVFFDLFETFVAQIEQALQADAVPTKGHSHGMTDRDQYFERMEAVNFTLNHDDGSAISQLNQADIILLGISRTGKTPTCLYLSLNYSIRAANFPITEDDLEDLKLPKSVEPLRTKLFGLTTSPERLRHIRQERLPNSRYASLAQCEYEIRQSEALFRRYRIPYLDTTAVSIEEIAANIVDMAALEHRKTLPTPN